MNDSYRFYILAWKAESTCRSSVEMGKKEMNSEIATVSLEARREQCF